MNGLERGENVAAGARGRLRMGPAITGECRPRVKLGGLVEADERL